MKREDLLKNIEKLIDDAAGEMLMEDAIGSYVLSVDVNGFLRGFNNNAGGFNPLDIFISNAAAGSTGWIEKDSALNLREEYFRLIDDEPETYKEKALIIADDLELLAKEIRAKYS